MPRWTPLVTAVWLWTCVVPTVLAGEVEFAGLDGAQLPRFALACMGSSGFGHGGYITEVEWSPDGNRIISFGQGGQSGHRQSVRVWNASTGQPLGAASVPARGRASYTAGQMLLLAEPLENGVTTQKFRVIDLLSGKDVRAYTHDKWTNHAVLSPNSRLAALSQLDWQVAIVELESGKVLSRIPAPSTKSNVSGFPTVQFSPDGSLLSVGDSEHTLKLFELKDPAAPASERQPIERGGWGKLVFSPIKEVAATIGGNGRVALWDLDTGTVTREWKHGPVSALDGAFSPDGGLLATCGADGYIRIWDTATGSRKVEINTDERHPNAVVFSPKGNILASGGGHGKVRLWDPKTGQELPLTRDAPSTGAAQAVALDPSGKLVAAAGELGLVTLWELAPGKQGQVLPDMDANGGGRFDPRVGPTWLAFSPSGDRLIAGSSNQHNSVNVWDSAKRERIHQLAGHVWPITAAACSTDGKTYASGSRDKTIRLWNQSGEPLRTMTGSGAEVLTIAFSPREPILASAGFSKDIEIWNTASGERIKSLGGGKDDERANGVLCLTFAGDGKLAASYGNGLIRIWDAAAGKVLKTIGNEGEPFQPDQLVYRSIAYSPLSSTLAAAGSDGKVSLFNADTGDKLAELIGHDAPVASVGWHPGGKLLVSGGEDAVIYVWDAVRAVK